MSKNSLSKFPSVKNPNIGQRASKQQHQLYQTTKQQNLLCQTATHSDKKIFEPSSSSISSSQNQIAKKIQNKLRMRKASGSQKKLNTQTFQQHSSKDFPSNNEISSTSSNQQLASSAHRLHYQEVPDPTDQLKEQISSLWENSQPIYECLTSPLAERENPNQLYQEVLKEVSFILCQVNKGEKDLEAILVEKIKKMCRKASLAQKCSEKEKQVNGMFEDRLVKLSMILRTR